MAWKFDQAPNVACIASPSLFEGYPVLIATHYEDDHSWSFTDGEPTEAVQALVVAMSEIVDRHPDLDEIAELPPGWSATRKAVGEPWAKRKDDWGPNA